MLRIPLDKWATAFTPTPFKKWGMNTSNASESVNKWMNDERNLSHLHIHSALVAKVMERHNSRRKIQRRYTSIAPTALFPKRTEDLLSNRMDHGAKLRVKEADEDKFLVENKWEVNLDRDNPKCSCNELRHTGLPCEHMAAALQSVEGNMDSQLEGRRLISFSTYAERCYCQGRMTSFYRAVVEPCALKI